MVKVWWSKIIQLEVSTNSVESGVEFDTNNSTFKY